MKHSTRCLRITMLTVLFAGLALSQSWSKADFSSRTVGGYTGLLPATLTQVITSTMNVRAIILRNNSVSSVTVRVRAATATAECGNAACVLVIDDLPIAGKTQYCIPLYDMVATGGVSWSASDATNVTGTIVGTY